MSRIIWITITLAVATGCGGMPSRHPADEWVDDQEAAKDVAWERHTEPTLPDDPAEREPVELKDKQLAVWRDASEHPRWAQGALHELAAAWQRHGVRVSDECYEEAANARIELWEADASGADGYCWGNAGSLNGCAFGAGATIQMYSTSGMHTLAHEFNHLLTWCEDVPEEPGHAGPSWDVWLPAAVEGMDDTAVTELEDL